VKHEGVSVRERFKFVERMREKAIEGPILAPGF